MSDLIVCVESQLPAKIDDLARFVLIGQEKLTALKAEIRAIDRIGLAKEVEMQKRQEARQLSDLIIVASIRIGELTAKIPTASGARTDLQPTVSADNRFHPKTKKQIIEEMGLSQSQVSRFETLAKHPDLVERVRSEARENDDLPTRTAVLSLAKYKKDKEQAAYQQIDEDARLGKTLNETIATIRRLPSDPDSVKAMVRSMPGLEQGMLHDIINAVEKITKIKRIFESEVLLNGQKKNAQRSL